MCSGARKPKILWLCDTACACLWHVCLSPWPHTPAVFAPLCCVHIRGAQQLPSQIWSHLTDCPPLPLHLIWLLASGSETQGKLEPFPLPCRCVSSHPSQSGAFPGRWQLPTSKSGAVSHCCAQQEQRFGPSMELWRAGKM